MEKTKCWDSLLHLFLKEIWNGRIALIKVRLFIDIMICLEISKELEKQAEKDK
jgi:ABC-type transport system involved in cytochrome c biogenesis permease subunit